MRVRNVSSESKVITTNLMSLPKISVFLRELREYHLETYYHSVRVSNLAVEIGKSLGLQNEEQVILGQCGLLHDIGKIKISKMILDKASKLSNKEWETMKKHPEFSFYLLKEFDCPFTKSVALYHHYFGKKSYPKINGREIIFDCNKTKLYIQIVCLCDIFDALISKRSYKPEFDLLKAKTILQEEFCGDENLKDLIGKLV